MARKPTSASTDEATSADPIEVTTQALDETVPAEQPADKGELYPVGNSIYRVDF